MAQQGWSADGTKLVFTCTCPQNTNSFGPHSGVYTANADGSDLTKLNDDGQYPDWSPDGTTIAFFSDRDGNEEVSTIRRDGTGLTRVTDTPAYEEFPIWTPDGRIAFSRGEPNDTETPPTWHLVDADGSSEVPLPQLDVVEAGFADWIDGGATTSRCGVSPGVGCRFPDDDPSPGPDQGRGRR